MHLAVMGISLIAAWKWGDWRNWKTYLSTMYYAAICDLLYLFLTANHFLWRYVSDSYFANYSGTELIYAFIVLPATTLMFISRFPHKLIKAAFYILMWIIIYILLEVVLLLSDRFVYQHGWNLIWSIGFDVVMFPMIILHHKKPLLTYLLSICFICYLVWQFEVPVHLPIENR